MIGRGSDRDEGMGKVREWGGRCSVHRDEVSYFQTEGGIDVDEGVGGVVN